MPLIRSIGDRSFTPEQLAAITTAFNATCRDLGLVNRDDAIVHVVAKVVIDAASGNECDAEQIRRLALKRLISFSDAGDVAMTALVRDAIVLTGADLGNIQAYDASDQSLAIIAHDGFKQEFLCTFKRVSLDDSSACARAMRAKMPILIDDVSLDDDFQEYREIAQRAGFISVLSVPLITASEEFVGVLSVHSARARSLRRVRMDMLNDYARHVADVLPRAFAEPMMREPGA
jgi:GAF domain-containing protein